MKTIPSKGTRLFASQVIAVLATLGWLASIIAVFSGVATIVQIEAVGVTFDNWKATMVMVLGVYALSESMVKGGEAYMNKGRAP